MKKGLLFLMLVVSFVIIGCVPKEPTKVEKVQEPSIPEDYQKPLPSIPQSQGLGNLCSGEEECISFCLDNRAKCEDYCRENENELCSVIFPPEETLTPEQIEIERIRRGCEGTKTKFDYAPVNLDKTKVFLPLGLMTGDHVTPIDHHYFQNFDNTEFDIETYSPGDGYITDIGHSHGAEEGKDYHIRIQHSCTISSLYIYVSNLPEKIKRHAPGKNGYAGVNIPVEAGELIGYYKNNLDYSVVDEEVVLTGFVVPYHYRGERWKIHVPNTLDYFNEPIRSKLIEKSVRTAEPISGKIDYDIDGRLVGNWFLEGTDGYAGDSTSFERYWLGHLSIVYDAYDPTRIVISIAGYEDRDSRQFGVKGNSPDPADVGIGNGLIKYELVDYYHITSGGGSWDAISPVKISKTASNEIVQGIVLVQMIETRKIKFETFPGKTASQVSDFTENAKIYER